MRMIVALPLLLLAACSVESDPRNNQISLDYDAEAIENTAESLGNAAEDAVSEVGNAAERAGREIENEVGDIDVDIDVSRNKSGDGK